MAEPKKKRINTKAKGTRLEHRTMRVLEAAGYKCCGSVEMETLHSFQTPANCSREVWVWKDRARQPIIEVL